MEQGVAATSTPTAAPDWSAISREILCPLCDYNLRGLIESRCPECGHQFKWDEVLAAGDPIHPYLFEHQPHRPVWAFVTTLRRSLFPRSFWTTVLSIHRPVPARLIRYWALLLLPGLVCAMVILVMAFPQQQAYLEAYRRQLTNQLNSPSYSPEQIQSLIGTYGSIAAAIDQYAPPPTFWNTLRWMFQNDPNLSRHIVPFLGSVLLWPCPSLRHLYGGFHPDLPAIGGARRPNDPILVDLGRNPSS